MASARMTSLATLVFILIAAPVPPVRAADSVDEPEKRIEISIYDLLGKKPGFRARGASEALMRGYVEKVIAVVQESKGGILKCLRVDENLSARYRLEIRGDGSATVESTPSAGGNAIAACVARELAQATYPRHRYSKPVVIEIPLESGRRRL